MIPLSTTTISIVRTRLSGNEDPYDPSAPSPGTVATGVRAAISVPASTTTLVGGQRVSWTARCTADPCDMQAGDTVVDADGNQWQVLAARQITTLMPHVQAELRQVTGAT